MNVVERNQKIRENENNFKETFENCKYAYAILQLPIDAPYKFWGYENIVNYLNMEPCRNDYKILFAERCIKINVPSKQKVNAFLESIFRRFNSDGRPSESDNYYGTSLSVSDVILLKIKDDVTAYFVDNIGFKELKNFEI